MAAIAFVADPWRRADRARDHPGRRPDHQRDADAVPDGRGDGDPAGQAGAQSGQARPGLRRGLQQLRISGLAGRVAERATAVGWSVVGSDNWYGTIPTIDRLLTPSELNARPSCWPATWASSAPRPRSTRCGWTGSRVVLTGELG